MSRVARVFAAPTFAGGRLRTFNRVVRAAARGSEDACVTLLLLEDLRGEDDRALRVLNAHGDPIGLPLPSNGALGDARERALWRAALLDVMPPTASGPDAVERFLPAAGAEPLEAARALWSSLLPGVVVRAVRAGGEAPDAEPCDLPPLVWIGAHQRRALDELGMTPQELVRPEAGEPERYRPELKGDLAEACEAWEASAEPALARLRGLTEEIEPSLLGAWSRLQRSHRRGLEEFRAAAERCLDNHAGIRRRRWHGLAQALRPAGRSQEDGLGILAAVAQFGLQPEKWRDYARIVRENTRKSPGGKPIPLFLDC